jgi:uncharacterized protein (DUF3084 family)
LTDDIHYAKIKEVYDMQAEYIIILIGFILSQSIAIIGSIYNAGGDMGMKEAIITGICTVIAAVISAIVTKKAGRKSQVNENTKAIQELQKQLGLDDKKTLRTEILESLEKIGKEIGVDRNDASSLTSQHKDMQRSQEKSYEEIKSRYKAEDEAYHRFTLEQRDIKDTMSNFVRQYTELISDLNSNENEIIDLQEENRVLKEDNEKLIYENPELESLLREYQEQQMEGEER